MARVLRLLSASAVTLVAALAFTIVYLYASVRGARAVSVEALQAVTIRSPIYWPLLLLVLAGVAWLFRGWVKG
ncbi:MAG TPA: hypothetical protein VI386_02680 [Candidatus Sulfotelmatobacter sp.]